MRQPVTVSIVVPAVGPSERLAETLQSLLDQQFPALDVLVFGGGARGTISGAARQLALGHPKIFRVRDGGPGDLGALLNQGFADAPGEVLACLPPGCMLSPRALESVMAYMPQRPVAIGGSRFVLRELPDAGVEQPAAWDGRFDHLAVWRRGFDAIPLSSLFWSRDAWIRAGGACEGEPEAVAYDLVCRFARRFPIHTVCEAWSAQWVDPVVPARSEAEILDLLIRASRRNWGPWWSPLRWRCEASFRLHLLQAHERARHHARRAETATAQGRNLRALAETLATWAWSPAMARGRFGSARRRGDDGDL